MKELLDLGGLVMVLQGALGFAALAFVLERILFFQGEGAKLTDLMVGARSHAGRGNFAEAAREAARAPGAAARVAGAVLSRSGLPRTELRQVAEEAVCLEVPGIERNLRGLLGVALLAPLAGMLGTVLGMVDLLGVGTGLAGLAELSVLKGLAKCLLTTAAGLGVSVFAYAGYLWLRGRAERLLAELKRTGVEAVNLVCDFRGQGAGGRSQEEGGEEGDR